MEYSRFDRWNLRRARGSRHRAYGIVLLVIGAALVAVSIHYRILIIYLSAMFVVLMGMEVLAFRSFHRIIEAKDQELALLRAQLERRQGPGE